MNNRFYENLIKIILILLKIIGIDFVHYIVTNYTYLFLITPTI